MASNFLGIDHVQIAGPIGCEEAARDFFSGVLGMPEICKPVSLAGRGGVWFQCGHQELHIGVQTDFIPALKAHPALLVGDLSMVIRDLNTSDIAIEHPQSLPNAQRIFVVDPFGNRIELIERN